MKKRKVEAEEEISRQDGIRQSMDASRFWALTFTLLLIGRSEPFNIVEDPRMRYFFSHIPGFPKQLSVEAVRRHVIELYLSIKKSMVTTIDHMKSLHPNIPFFHLNVDLWTCVATKDKYLGVRVYFVDENFVYRSLLLACKVFKPASVIRSQERLSDILKSWVFDVLEEFHLSQKDLMSSTTDAGSDIRRLCDVLLPSAWEWCIPHLLNCALAEAFGTALDAASSKNHQARAAIIAAKKVVEHVNKSHPTKILLEEFQIAHTESAITLASDVPQRWKSTIYLLERFLSLWTFLRVTYSRMGKEFPLRDIDHTLLIQLYSIMAPIGELITDAQCGLTPGGPSVVLALARLRRTLLNCVSPLRVLDPGQRFQLTSDNKITEMSTPVSPVMIEHGSLHPVAKDTRERLVAAIEERFFSRYAANDPNRPSMYDCCAALYPPLRMQHHISCLAPSLSLAEVNSMRRNAFQHIRELAIRAASVTITLRECEPPAAKTAKTSHPGASDSASALKDAWDLELESLEDKLFHVSNLPAADTSALTAERIVDAEMMQYMSMAMDKDQLTPQHVLLFWKENQHRFPHLAVAARAILGFAVSAAGIERDFSAAGLMISPRRNRLHAALAEMSVFVKLNSGEYCPDLNEVESINTDDVKSLLPRRFRRDRLKDSLALSYPEAFSDLHDDVDTD